MVVNSLSKETTRDTIQIDVLLSEDQIAQEFIAALARHELPEKFFSTDFPYRYGPGSISAMMKLIGILSALSRCFKPCFGPGINVANGTYRCNQLRSRTRHQRSFASGAVVATGKDSPDTVRWMPSRGYWN